MKLLLQVRIYFFDIDLNYLFDRHHKFLEVGGRREQKKNSALKEKEISNQIETHHKTLERVLSSKLGGDLS